MLFLTVLAVNDVYNIAFLFGRLNGVNQCCYYFLYWSSGMNMGKRYFQIFFMGFLC